MATTLININNNKRYWTYDDIEWWKNPEDSNTNALITFKDNLTRLRAGVLIIKGDEILLGEEASQPGEFAIPGGGLEFGETPIQAAIREAQEEVHINIKNAQETGFDYCLCKDEPEDWVKQHVPVNRWWYNYYTCLIISEYDDVYKGKVDKEDQDKPMQQSSKWYKISEVIDAPTFKTQWKRALVKFSYYNSLLTEDTRTQLISASRNAGPYKGDTTRGKNRFERKKFSKVSQQVKSYNQINMDDFFKKDLLEINIPVTGETKDYVVTLRLNGVLAEIAKNIKNNSNKFEYRTVLQALTKIFNTTNVYIKCTCDDFKYRFKHYSIINNWGVDDSSQDPGPGKGIANPVNDKGKGCKHCLLVLNNQVWIMKVTSVIHNYINYAQEHLQKPFQKLIFPKLYSVDYEDAAEENLVPEDTKLESEKHIIDIINDWAKNRGKFKPGTNKNPITGTGGKNKKDESEESKS